MKTESSEPEPSQQLIDHVRTHPEHSHMATTSMNQMIEEHRWCHRECNNKHAVDVYEVPVQEYIVTEDIAFEDQ